MSFSLPGAPRMLLEGRPAAIQALLLAATLVIFGGAVANRFTSWDDDIYVTQNPLIRDVSLEGVSHLFTSFSNCNYHPVTYLTFMAEYAAVGLEPWLYHLDSILIHAAAGLLAFQLVRRWLGSDAVAALAALLFLIHPTRVESVAWVAERKDVLCAFFYFASLLLYTSFLDRGGRGRYAAALGLFLLAILSKMMAVTLPAVLAVLLVVRRRTGKRDLFLLTPFVVLSIVFSVVGVMALSAEHAIKGLHGGEVLPHLLTPLKALAFYAAKLLVPVRLSARYFLEPATGLLDPLVLAGAVLALLGGWAACWSFRRRPAVFLGISWFAL
ncbi:MAG TPA: glycosyltransferase family 39 protein, partial [Planctomycetota bacterium]|nr:glycosyltransferase family 39 protein [Planctomycetota bacterium]